MSALTLEEAAKQMDARHESKWPCHQIADATLLAWRGALDPYLTQPAQSVDVIEQVVAELRQGDLNDEECLALANQLTAALQEKGNG